MRRIITFTLLAILAVPAFCQTPATGKSNGHEYVDLGLSVKWATCNIGASSPTDFGSFFSWGETSTNDFHDWETYKFRVSGDSHDNVVVSKYNSNSGRGTIDNKTVLDYSDDAAYVNWGNTWRMATLEEWGELRSKCTWSWTTLGGKSGFKITGPNGNSIFLPAAGQNRKKNLFENSRGYYWVSEKSGDTDSAWNLSFFSDGVYIGLDARCSNWSIRPVYDASVANGKVPKSAMPQVDDDKSSSKTANATADKGTSASSGTVNNFEYVDLGLSVKWATCNVGAFNPLDRGSLYAWGETEAKNSCIWANYKHRLKNSSPDDYVFSKYNTKSEYGQVDNKTRLEISWDDVAHWRWGGKWRIPTKEEWEELLENCTWSYCQRDRWHVGYFQVISKKNGNSILLPFPGYMAGNLNDRDYDGYYWTSSLNPEDPTHAYYIHISSGGGHKMENTKGRWNGFSIRPVID